MASFEATPSAQEEDFVEDRESKRRIEPFEEARKESGILSKFSGRARRLGSMFLLGSALVLAPAAVEAQDKHANVGGKQHHAASFDWNKDTIAQRMHRAENDPLRIGASAVLGSVEDVIENEEWNTRYKIQLPGGERTEMGVDNQGQGHEAQDADPTKGLNGQDEEPR